MITKEEALDYHQRDRHGKIEVCTTKPCITYMTAMVVVDGQSSEQSRLAALGKVRVKDLLDSPSRTVSHKRSHGVIRSGQ